MVVIFTLLGFILADSLDATSDSLVWSDLESIIPSLSILEFSSQDLYPSFSIGSSPSFYFGPINPSQDTNKPYTTTTFYQQSEPEGGGGAMGGVIATIVTPSGWVDSTNTDDTTHDTTGTTGTSDGTDEASVGSLSSSETSGGSSGESSSTQDSAYSLSPSYFICCLALAIGVLL